MDRICSRLRESRRSERQSAFKICRRYCAKEKLEYLDQALIPENFTDDDYDKFIGQRTDLLEAFAYRLMA